MIRETSTFHAVEDHPCKDCIVDPICRHVCEKYLEYFKEEMPRIENEEEPNEEKKNL